MRSVSLIESTRHNAIWSNKPPSTSMTVIYSIADLCGLLVQYAAIGFVDSVLPATIYPFLQNYLNAEGSTVLTARVLVKLPWAFKVFYEMLSDCFPLFGYRHRPYIAIGWIICLVGLVIMSSIPIQGPYYSVAEYRRVRPEHYTPEIVSTFNREASTQATKFVLLMMICAFGYLLVDVCADGLMVKIAQREPEERRGKSQALVYTTRIIFGMIGIALVGFGLNSEDYGGTFDFSIGFSELMQIVAILLCPVLPLTWFLIQEACSSIVSCVHDEPMEADSNSGRLSSRLSPIFLGNIRQYHMYSFHANSFDYANVEPINEKVFEVVGSLIFAISISSTLNYGLQWDWRKIIMITMLSSIGIDMVPTLLTIWNLVRNQWFWLGMPIVLSFPQGISFIISAFVSVELAEPSNEAAVYRLMTTVNNISVPFGASLTKLIDKQWDLSNERIKTDTLAVRLDITKAYMLMYMMSAF
uniref:Transmembrane protein putative n=1 Tax=Albugo laibachii Nc14 TaxID=890382 RepID=F0WLD5_9STRA|nr:transmembrane protein putative [Albugo laibachii Nc14]|eukprot:CCA22098.1 transmembrane protein putative [Albugo laibachii Nc14]